MKKVKPKVLTPQQAYDLLARIEAEVSSGRMRKKDACKKFKMPVYKYSYWKKMKDESDALDKMIEEHEKDEGEVLYDSSPLAIRERLRKMVGLEKDIEAKAKLNHDTNNKAAALVLENAVLKQRIHRLEALIVDKLLMELKI
jgi:hypothetical protein